MSFARTIRYFDRLQLIPDINRGEQRFAAEVRLAELRGEAVPAWAQERAIRTIEGLANN